MANDGARSLFRECRRAKRQNSLPGVGTSCRYPLGTLVSDQRTVTLAQFAADVQAQAAGATFRGEERLERVALRTVFQWLAVAPHAQARPGRRGGLGCITRWRQESGLRSWRTLSTG